MKRAFTSLRESASERQPNGLKQSQSQSPRFGNKHNKKSTFKERKEEEQEKVGIFYF